MKAVLYGLDIMFPKLFSTILAFTVVTFHTTVGAQAPHVLSEHTYSLSDRYSNTYVNNVFADNILLTLAYMSGQAQDGHTVDWAKVKAPFNYQLVLMPHQTFAFHDQVLDGYKGKISETTNAHFNSQEGFESDGWLVADGVCHLASFMNVVARDAGLKVESPTPHDFAVIPDVPKASGVAIYYMPGEEGTSSLQNLYITNSLSKPITFVFRHTSDKLTITVQESN